MITSSCQTCGKVIEYYPSRPRRYCTKKCFGQASLRTANDFWSRVNVRAKGHCWLWTGSVSATNAKGGGGYGTLKWNRRYWYAHQVAWLVTHGPIPEGQWVLHKCDKRLCCNPGHLKLGTHQDNMDDMVSHGRSKGHP